MHNNTLTYLCNITYIQKHLPMVKLAYQIKKGRQKGERYKDMIKVHNEREEKLVRILIGCINDALKFEEYEGMIYNA